ncbi:hypothetical protein SAMN02982922_5616 [Mesorhizobium australicum]|uniref:Sulfotransferase family protein n=2 Tax=Mesorhizobium australicum TaxID=536018 RepID=A0A1X7PXH5_9HYPH|nr:hypothetical protein SAMN02982922_5616 [Mesorhizobium australicum]
MGKTGSTTIQAALAQNDPALLRAGYLYLGQWLDIIRPEFDQFQGFQAFLKQKKDEFELCADIFVQEINRIGQEKGVQNFLISNEQYLENIDKLDVFFKRIERHVELKIIIFVRPPASWLPSAYIQWGVVHKTNLGPVRSFSVKARELIRQYDFIRRWREIFGSNVSVVLLDDNTDSVAEFSRYLGVDFQSASGRQQVRPSSSETLLRGACNNTHPQMALPDLYNAVSSRGVPAGTPRSLSSKFSHVFDVSEISQILAENSETISYLEREFGFNLSKNRVQPEQDFDLSELTDHILGTMMDLVFSQAHQIKRLAARVESLERRDERK